MQLPTIKKYDIDYEFLIKNYLDPSLWEKKWALLEYKMFIISISLESINCQDNSIMFRVSCEDNEYLNKGYEYECFKFNIKNSSISFLKKSIKRKIINLIYLAERKQLKKSNGYQDVEIKYSNERYLLTKIANDFLDKEGVTNAEIRDCYVDNFVYTNEQLDLMLSRYLSSGQYKILPDFYLLISKIYKDEKLENDVYKHISDELIEDLSKEVQELYDYIQTEEYEEEMKGELDGI